MAALFLFAYYDAEAGSLRWTILLQIIRSVFATIAL